MYYWCGGGGGGSSSDNKEVPFPSLRPSVSLDGEVYTRMSPDPRSWKGR